MPYSGEQDGATTEESTIIEGQCDPTICDPPARLDRTDIRYKLIFSVHGISEYQISNISDDLQNPEDIESITFTRTSDKEVKVIKSHKDHSVEELILDPESTPSEFSEIKSLFDAKYEYYITCGRDLPGLTMPPLLFYKVQVKNERGETVKIPDNILKPYNDATKQSNGEWFCVVTPWNFSHENNREFIEKYLN